MAGRRAESSSDLRALISRAEDIIAGQWRGGARQQVEHKWLVDADRALAAKDSGSSTPGAIKPEALAEALRERYGSGLWNGNGAWPEGMALLEAGAILARLTADTEGSE